MPEKFPKGDWGNTITVTFQEDGTAIDLSALSITTKTVSLWAPNGSPTAVTASFGNPPGDGSDGVLSITIPEDTLDAASTEWKVYGTVAGATFQFSTLPTTFEVVDTGL